MADEKNNNINPLSYAITFSLFGALEAFIGAKSRMHPADDSAMVILIGGAIIGPAAGFLGWGINACGDGKSFIQKLSQTILWIAALLTTPLVGKEFKEFVENDISWNQLIIDELIGAGIITGGLLAIGGFAYCVLALCCSNESTQAPNYQGSLYRKSVFDNARSAAAPFIGGQPTEPQCVV